MDLRVDEHPEPITELHRIYEVFKVQMLPFVGALPTRKNPRGDLDDIRHTLIPDGASQDGRASEGAPEPELRNSARDRLEELETLSRDDARVLSVASAAVTCVGPARSRRPKPRHPLPRAPPA